MVLDSLDIALFYEHPDAGTWSLLDLRNHKGVIAVDDLAPDAFLNAAGAMKLYCDRFKCFLQTGAAGELRSYVYFLIESMVSLVNPRLAKEFPCLSSGVPFLDYGDVVAGLFQENQTRIVLRNAEDEVAISYLNQNGDAPDYRLSPYFRDVRVAARLWRLVAAEALDEYFAVAEERLQPGKEGELYNLCSSWRSHRDSLCA